MEHVTFSNVERAMQNSLLALGGAALALSLSACEAAPRPSPSPSVRLLTPPQPVLDRLPHFGQTFQALAPERYPMVRVTPDTAVQTVLAGGPGWNWGDVDFTLRNVGCVFVVWVTERPMSYAPNPVPPYAAYLVQLLGDERGVPGAEVLVVVNATTGEMGSAYGASLGTTCGIDRSPVPSASSV